MTATDPTPPTGKRRGCGVYVLSDDGERVLLAQRGTGARHGHYKWEGPGGEAEDGETFEQAAIREVREELGVDVKLNDVAGEFEEFTDPNGQLWEAVIFTGHISEPPVIQEPTKCVGYGWFTKPEVKQLEQADCLVDYIVKDLQTIGWL